jgi:hypothetical protein
MASLALCFTHRQHLTYTKEHQETIQVAVSSLPAASICTKNLNLPIFFSVVHHHMRPYCGRTPNYFSYAPFLPQPEKVIKFSC